MTLRDPRAHIPTGDRSPGWRLRRQRRRKDRRLLSESLEQRQLLAGPDLIGVQPNEGTLIQGGEILNVSPREIVFRFDDNTQLDPATLGGIRITRAGEDGVFESATATSDLGTAGQVLVEFRAIDPGALGNGIVVEFTSSSRPGSSLPLVTVSDRTVTFDLNSNPSNPTRVQGLQTAVANSVAARELIEVIPVSGSTQTPIGAVVPDGLSLTLAGANAAQAETDFGTNGAVRVRIVSQLSGADGLGTQINLERRNFGGPANPVVVVNGQSILVQLNSATGFESTAQDFIDAINGNPDSAALIQVLPQQGDLATPIGGGTNSLPSLLLSGVTDVAIEPGFIGLGDSPREVVFRFAEPLPDDLYQIDVLGTGPSALLNTDGEAFNDGVDETRQFTIDLGPKVVAVVPEPIRRNASGQLVPEVGIVEVHFNDDALDPSTAEDADFYQLIYTRDTARTTDDTVITPINVDYNATTNIATLDFGLPLARVFDTTTADPSDFITGAARLRVGSSDALPLAPTVIDVTSEPGDTFSESGRMPFELSIGSGAQNSLRLTSEIDNVDRFDLDLPGPDVPGTRQIRPDDPTRFTDVDPLDYVIGDADASDSISVLGYNFAESWLGDDPSTPDHDLDRTYFNVISEQQKQRVREVMTMFSEYLGINFIESEDDLIGAGVFSIAVGDLYGTSESEFDNVTSGPGGFVAAVRDRNFDGIPDLGVLDFHDFDESTDDQFSGEFFRSAMYTVGRLIGYGNATDLPQPITQPPPLADVDIYALDNDIEPSFPSVVDITHGQYLHRPDSTDVDLYSFELTERGTLSIETMAERLADASLLDTALRLYRLGSDGSYQVIAQNNDYFSNDSLIEIQADPGSYVVGVSAHGNTSYDPEVAASGFGGLSEGEYELILDFKPDASNGIVDAGPLRNPLDGDGDGRAGGVFNFWFVPAGQTDTLYVDKAASPTATANGSITNPFREIDQAIAAALPGMTIRVVGNGGVDGRVETLADNFSYKIGFDSLGLPLEDGSTLELPRGVRMVIDSGAILKMSRSRIGVGSTAPLVDVSNSALQVLGTPTIVTAAGLPARDATGAFIPGSVFFTSINDSSIGNGGSTGFVPAPDPGDWGGIDFRGDLDVADENRRFLEADGIFLNHIQFADLRYGGGEVSVGGRQVVVSPIDMAVTRVTVINSRIANSADAAIAATPDTFVETRFTEPIYQDSGAFTPDYSRIGPRISGNTIIDNSINGLFIRVVTRTGDVLEKVNKPARFDDTDVVHVLAENLVINGTPGGSIVQASGPSTVLVRTTAVAVGDVPAGSYLYRLTNVDDQGLESAASAPTSAVTLADTGGIRLDQLPTANTGDQFVARRLYRATIDEVTQLPGPFRLVAQLNASSTSFTDTAAAGTTELATDETVLRSRLDASLKIDPGTVLKIDGARIETRFGSDLIAEGLPSLPIVFTSIEDQRYGAGGTFDTNDRGDAGQLTPGDWGGLYIGHAGSASLDQTVIAGGGGSTRIEGALASFNAIEVQQGDLRLANSRLENNADGRGIPGGDRVGRGDNEAGTVFVRAAQPVIVGNTFIGGQSAAISIDLNSLSGAEVLDPGRATGMIDHVGVIGNYGPLVQGNVLDNNVINGMHVRGGELTTAGVWDDVDIVHVVTDSVEIPNRHIFGGLRLQSDARGSLVVKFETADSEPAGIVVGGSLLSAEGEFRDIATRIGGALQVVGHPDFPVVLTTLADDTAGAGFTRDGIPGVDTNNDGIAGTDLASQDGRLPTGPEVNNGLLIDNDVDPQMPGFFNFTPGPGGGYVTASTTVQGLTQVFEQQFSLFDYGHFIDVGADGDAVGLGTTTITLQPTLIADDRVASEGNFAGANGQVNWRVETFFEDGGVDLISTITLESDQPLGDLRFINYYDPIIGSDAGDALFTEGTPGTDDFRLTILDAPEVIGFRQYGAFEPGPDLQGATYEGWIADLFPDLITDPVFDLPFTTDGTIDLADVPQQDLPQFPLPNYGPGIITSALGWLIDPTATTATLRTNLQVIAEVFGSSAVEAEAGLWNGVVIREGADDRNVAAFAEEEPTRSSFVDSNDFLDGRNEIPGQAQFLGEIAPNEQSGDENRRLGFIVNGAITTRNDLDVYSFIAESGTEVWLDIDQTRLQLDTVIELIDANGVTLAANNSSILSETNPLAIYPTPATANPRLDLDAARPLTTVSDRVPNQEITFSESIFDATGGTVALTIEGSDLIVPVDVPFLQTFPEFAVEFALSEFPEFGDAVSVRRISGATDDLTLQVEFDGAAFLGREVPRIDVDTVGVIGATVTAAVTEGFTGSQLQDDFTSNPKDAGMRIVLPGEFGTRNLYHVRVRSSNTNDPLDMATLVDPDRIRDGKSMGAYQLQIRLSEVDEHAGTQIRSADVRYATDGLHIIGQPLHSPLTGEEHETTDDNDSRDNAQRLGAFGESIDVTATEAGPLQSDRLAKSFAGKIESLSDVDWYRFEVDYDDLVGEDETLHLSTVFDLDYAGGFGRADMALYVFNENGELILAGGDANIADDLPPTTASNSSADLSRGSSNSDDPFIGAAELIQGTYYVAVAHQQNVPLPLDQFFNPDSANPLLRLEPIDSVTRIAEDHIDSFDFGTADLPLFPVLFDSQSIVPHTLDDVLLYVNTGSDLHLVNPFTGQDFGVVGDFLSGGEDEELREIAFRDNGELFAYNIPSGTIDDTSLLYYRIDTGTAALTGPLSQGANVATFEATVTINDDGPDTYNPVAANSGINVEAIAIASLGGAERGFLVANRAPLSGIAVTAGADYDTNILYQFDPEDGNATGTNVEFLAGPAGTALSGAATNVREVGQIGGLNPGEFVTGVDLVANDLYGVTSQGRLVRVFGGQLNGFGARSIGGPIAAPELEALGLSFTALSTGPLSYNDGELRQTLFGLTASGDIYAFNTAGELQGVFAGGASMISTGIGGASGLDFSILAYNLWHPTATRGSDPGHGIPALANGARAAVDGGNSLAFNYERDAHNGNYPFGERPEVLNSDGTIANPRQDGAQLNGSFNLPGGARGIVQSNPFSLAGYAPADQPTLYFNYFLDADEGERTDVLRVYVATPDGAQHLVATNNLEADEDIANQLFDDEFDDPPQVGIYDDNIDVETQQLYDSTGSWRQVRIPLNSFAGMQDLSLRIEYSTAGTFVTDSITLQLPTGDRLIDGDTFTIDGQVFSIDLEAAVGMPAGGQLAAIYQGTTSPAVVEIEGQAYALDDGTRTISADQIAVDLFAGLPTGTTLTDLSAAQVAEALVNALSLFPPPNLIVDGLSFQDDQDADPAAPAGRNDTIGDAVALPYSGGRITFVGQGQFGNDANVGDFAAVADPLLLAPTNLGDVDLISVNVAAGTQVAVSLSQVGDIPISSAVRFFDENGFPLTADVTGVNAASVTTTQTGLIYIGLSGIPNTVYDPVDGSGVQSGDFGKYEASISINPAVAIQTIGNQVELGGFNTVTASPVDLFSIDGVLAPVGTSVPISRTMTAAQVAAAVQRVLADSLGGGNSTAFPTNKNLITIESSSVDDPGPLVPITDRWGQQFGAGPLAGTRDNDFEGVYLDDFIIGLAERGEIATGANPITTEFVIDARPGFADPADPVNGLDIGEYQVEIRDASEYIDSFLAEIVLDDDFPSSQFLTRDSNARISDAYSITARPAGDLVDGATFSISDGRVEVTFEFSLTEAGNGVAPGNVEIPFTLRMVDPISGALRAETAAEVAANIVRAINRADVQALVRVPAVQSDGISDPPAGGVEDPENPTLRSTSPRINLFADIAVVDHSDSLAAIEHATLRGDDNRDRDGQGVILIENSRFLRNSQHGIKISHGLTATVAGQVTDSIVRYPRNLVELNVENIKPGVVVQSNVLAFNAIGGLQINGIDPAANETTRDPVAYDRIVNNTIIGGEILTPLSAPPQEFAGILFDSGRQAFADAVVSYVPDTEGQPPAIIHQTPDAAVGAPDGDGRGPEPEDGLTTVSLGVAGTLTLQFVDNLLTGSGNADPDIVIFETGEVESVRVEISRDGTTFFDVGIAGGLTSQLDIDAAGFGKQDRFAFVRLTDLRQGTGGVTSLGADIDAVGALSSVPVERFSAGGTGIELTGNAGPLLMNNIVANTTVGIQTDVTNTFPIFEANTYYRNDADAADGVGLGRGAQLIPDAELLFFGAADLVFVPATGSAVIDASTDSLEDRASLTAVKNPLGLAPSPVIAPRLDVSGQLRVDDPSVEGPGGLGERVFKDRGASDRGDQVGPRVVLLSPQAPNLGLQSGLVSVPAGQNAPAFFEVQLIDGLAPADVVPGTGIDDRTVSSSAVLLLKDGEVLIEGIDYRFGYNPSTNVFRLTPIAGVWEQDSTYVIRMVDARDAIIQASGGNEYTDAGVLRIVDSVGVRTRFEYETGIFLAPTSSALTADTADGLVIDVFDGETTISFELDNDLLFDVGNVRVEIPETGSAADVASALAAAVNASASALQAIVSDSTVQFLGSNPLSSVTVDSILLTTSGAIGTDFGFGIQVPNDGADVADSVSDGQTFIIRRGAATEVTFELDTNGSTETTDAVAVSFAPTASLDDVADAIVRAVAGAGLGLNPINVGFGRVLLGGDANYSVDPADSSLLAAGTPGQGPTLPIVIEIDQTAEQVAQTIADTIDDAALPGVTTAVFGTRIFLEGTDGVTGIGAADTVIASDLVGNQVQSNQPNGRTELSIFVGGGFDYGDAPYIQTTGTDGARHGVDETFALAPAGSIIPVSADGDPRLVDADEDNGVRLLGTVEPGFSTAIEINVRNDDGRTFYVDVWFDWNQNDFFDPGEQIRYGSIGTGRIPLAVGANVVSINVPPTAIVGETYARFRISEDGNLGASGEAASGEVEDYRIVVGNNPYQNPNVVLDGNGNDVGRYDVNNSGFVSALDALQIINTIRRNGGDIDLAIEPVPSDLPLYPDVNGDGLVTAMDALQIVNRLDQLEAAGEAPLVVTGGGYVDAGGGVLAAQATVIGDRWIDQARQEPPVELGTPIAAAVAKTSVFDSPAAVSIEAIVDTLAADTADRQERNADNPLDQIFASL